MSINKTNHTYFLISLLIYLFIQINCFFLEFAKSGNSVCSPIFSQLTSPNAKKYTDEELLEIINDDSRPILVAVDENNQVCGYAFLVFKQYVDNNIFTDIKTLYIDDLCVDEEMRGQHIGKELYEAVLAFAKENECYNVTLNVWSCNESAIKFYEKCGLKQQKIFMETIL